MPYICSMLQDGFKFFKPCRELRPYVRYYWAFKSSERLNALTFPIGCPQIIFHRKSPLRIPELGISQPRLAVSGQVNFPAHLCSEGDLEMVVAVFQPNAMKIFLHLPVFLLHNQEVSGHDLGNNELETLAEKITDCEDTSQCVAMTEQWLLAQMANAKTPQIECDIKRTTAAMRQLFAMPETPVAELASMACLGKKQFERLFRNMVGANPKRIRKDCALPEIVETPATLPREWHQPGTTGLPMRLCRPIAPRPGIQAIQRTDASVPAENGPTLFRPVHPACIMSLLFYPQPAGKATFARIVHKKQNII